MTRDEALAMIRKAGGLLDGHFQLTSGLHSGQYFQCAKVLQYPSYAEALCSAIAAQFRSSAPAAVIAPALGGIVVGQEVGRQLNVRTMFAERRDGAMQLRRGFEVRPGENVLVCEDVVTTGGSVQEVIEIVRGRTGNVVGVGAIVDRSGGKVVLPNLYAVLTLSIESYPPDRCPLCARGIPVEKPGSRGANPA